MQGYGVVWNAAMQNFTMEETSVFMNPQYLPGRNCMARLSEVLGKKECGMAGPMCNGFFPPQCMNIESIEHLWELEERERPEEKEALSIGPGLWALSKKTWEENGIFEEKLISAKNVILDYELRLIRKSYNPRIVMDALTYDMLCGRVITDYEKSFEKEDRVILKDRWNLNYFNVIPQHLIMSLIEEEKSKSLRVLEVGCDLGATLLEIKNQYPNSQVYGLEINKNAVAIAEHLAEVKVGNIEERCIPFEGTFDYIIFGDVLEHLHDPCGIVEFCREYLREDGCILASIPNLMHVSVMEQLLQGRFRYADMGLLDFTHIHFFTYYEIISMFQSKGYNIEHAGASIIELTETQEELIPKLMRISEGVSEDMYQSFQYLIRARKMGS